MNFFSDERAAELRELFFESAQDLLQELNEAGILLETDPGDSDALGRVRRAMHTLKGDSAACGFRQLSELAHDLEDLLTPQLVTERGEVVAEIVLSAADSFHAMLEAHRGNLQPPDITELRAHIRTLAETPKAPAGAKPSSESRHEWSNKDKARILDALRGNTPVFQVTLSVDPALQMPAAALQLIHAALEKCGTVLAQSPASGVPLQNLPVVHAALASSRPLEWISTRCRVPSIVSDVAIELLDKTEVEPRDALQILLEAETSAESPSLQGSESSHGEPGEGTHGSANQPAGVLNSTEAWLRVETGRIDTVMNLIGELIIGKSMLHRAINEFDQRFPKDSLRNRLGDVLSFQSRVLGELQKSVMKIRMVPVEQLFRRLPRIVRDVAKARKKEIAIEMAGQNTDLDKSVLDALADPMAHLVRNAADHGIETPEERLANGKSVRGTIRLDAYHQGNQVVIEVTDDGRGINHEKLMRKALEAGIISSDEAKSLSHDEILRLVFHPGLTTAEEVTEISGRGVGMDVVKTVMERLKGRVVVESEPGRGTKFQLIAPLTLASIQALMFRVENQHYAVPLDSVIEIARTTDNEIHRIDGHEVIRLREQVLSVVRLDQLIAAAPTSKKSRHFVVTIGAGSHRFGLIVDSLVGEEELVIKAFEDRLVASELVSGASILGDGTVVLILNVPAVVSHLSQKRAVEVHV
ncbi:MAG TPA: chemotaxis protein CheA [Verrucomicrobiae bacterium]|nr:chemotaxis protein CheA [Verrucomicrobiae bacterium]